MSLPEPITRESIQKMSAELIQEQHKSDLIQTINKIIKINEHILQENKQINIDISSNLSEGIIESSVNDVIMIFKNAGWTVIKVSKNILTFK